MSYISLITTEFSPLLDVWIYYVFLVTLIALFLDQLIGEFNKFHPLVLFGNYANFLQQRLNHKNFVFSKLAGAIAWSLAVIPFLYMNFLIDLSISQQLILDVVVVYFCVGHKSMKEHALKIYKPLDQNKLAQARVSCGMIVSRDVNSLSETQIVRATVESVLENTNDAVIASLFWFLVGGTPLVICHRLVNTLDAMWGYRNQKFKHFGYFAAKMDDLMAWPTAKITALLFAIQSLEKKRFIKSLSNAIKQSKQYKSLNGGWVMAAGATVLNIQLGGRNRYEGAESQTFLLGEGKTVCRQDILRSLKLMDHAVIIWFGLLLCIASFHAIIT